MIKIRCLIIDDEPVAQRVLERFVADVNFLELKGVCKDALEAYELLQTTPVDLLFLDINMPKLSGMAFYKSLTKPPAVIFTTAYPDYAVEGFDVNAVDYLVKPIAFDRFLAAAHKLRSQFCLAPSEAALWVKADKVTHKLHFEDIHYLEAFGDYVKIHCNENVLLTNDTLKNLQDQLPSATFVQLHKSFIVNVNKVTSVSGGQAFCQTNAIPVGRKYRDEFLKHWRK